MSTNLFYCPICFGNETDIDEEGNEVCHACGWPVDEFIPLWIVIERENQRAAALKTAVVENVRQQGLITQEQKIVLLAQPIK